MELTKDMELIDYINSLHNISASGTNTLAESQINSTYFADIYCPFPIVTLLESLLTKNQNTVIILTGHAGDGKSTIAFELLRKLGNDKYPSGYQFKEHEYLKPYNLNVLKDMSELSLDDRRKLLSQAFSSKGNWVIVSNTGPLLTSIAESLKNTEWGSHYKDYEIESEILKYLNEEINHSDDLSKVKLPSVDGKELYIVNIAKLNNIDIALQIFKKIVEHSEWQQILQNYPHHPISINYQTIKNNYQQVEESIRLTYLYLLNYEKRITLRQMLAHLSASLTAGLSLSNSYSSSTSRKNTPILFSDTFFGYIGDQAWHEAKNLKVMELVFRIHAGGYTSLEMEGIISDKDNFSDVQQPLKSIIDDYIDKDRSSESHKEKSSLRRILFMYGIQTEFQSDKSLFLGSPNVYKFNQWQLDSNQFENVKRKIKKSCEKALNLFYAGSDDKDHINITLKRSDASVFQISQLMVCSISKRMLRINYDDKKRLPYLYIKNKKNIRLDLSLPLLDYIENIVAGDISESLNPIYKTQLERFKLQLIEYAHDSEDDEITLVRMQSDGKLKKKVIFFEQDDDKTLLKMVD